MNTILIFLTAVATVVADVHELLGGYHYDKPITSYGVPSLTVLNKYNTGSSSGSSNNLNTGFGSILEIGSTVPPLGIVSTVPPLGIGTGYPFGGSLGQTYGGYNSGYTLTAGSGQTVGTGFTSGISPLSGLISDSTAGYQYQTAGQNNYQSTSNAGNDQSHYNFIQSGSPLIFKHIYVHTAPEDPEPPKPRQPIVLPPKQKHYNIIFVKTPTPPAGASQVIPVQEESEEKTIVYVLVQKPEEIKDVVLPPLTPKQPSKPEVFYIKYDGKDDAHGVINNIVNDYQKHDSVSINGIGVNHNELSGDNVVNQENLLNTYGTPLFSSDNKYVSSTEGSKIDLNKFGISSIGTSTVAPILIESSTPLYNNAGSISDFGTGNEVTIGSSNIGSGQINGGKFGGSNSYQTIQIDPTSNGLNNIETSSIKPIEISTVSPTSTLTAIVTGNDISSTTLSPINNFDSISTLSPINNFDSISTLSPINNFDSISTLSPINNFDSISTLSPINNFDSISTLSPINNFDSIPTLSPINNFNTISTLSPLNNFNTISTLSPLNNFNTISTLSPINNFNTISTGLNVPFETYGPPQFKP